jgi:hypothetical protein
MEFIVVDFDAGTELDDMGCTEVVSAELVGGTDLGSGRNRWMKRSCDGRQEYR